MLQCLAPAYASAHVFPEPTALEVQVAHGDGESSTQLVAQMKEDLTLKVDNYQSHVELLSRSIAQGRFLLSL